jgi:hypothetical protein
MTTLGALREGVEHAEKARDAAQQRIEAAEAEMTALTADLARLDTQRVELLKLAANGADVDEQLTDCRGWISTARMRLEELGELNPMLLEALEAIQSELETAKGSLSLGLSKRVRNDIRAHENELQAAFDAALVLWHRQERRLDRYAELGGDLGWTQATRAGMLHLLLHRPIGGQESHVFCLAYAGPGKPAGTPEREPNPRVQAMRVLDHVWIEVREPSEPAEAQTAPEPEAASVA